MADGAGRCRRRRRRAGSTAGRGATGVQLDGNDARIDAALAAVYDTKPTRRGGGGRAGGLGSSAPSVARWLGDIRRYFPTSVVQVLQRDAIDRLNLRQLLLEPEMLRAVEPDLHLVTLLVELNKLLPDTTRATARQVVVTGRRTDRAAAGVAHQAGGARCAGPQPAQPPAAAQRHRLGPHHPRQPAPLPARAAHRRSRAADRLRPPPAQPVARRDRGHRPVGQHGRQRRVRRGVRRRAGVDAGVANQRDRLRQCCCRPDADAARSGRRAVRCATGRRHRHRPSDRLLPAAGHPTRRHCVGAGQRSVRRRQHRAAARPCRRVEPGRASPSSCCWRSATRVLRRTTMLKRRSSPNSGCRHLPARPRRSPSCWPLLSNGATSVAGPTNTACTPRCRRSRVMRPVTQR